MRITPDNGGGDSASGTTPDSKTSPLVFIFRLLLLAPALGLLALLAIFIVQYEEERFSRLEVMLASAFITGGNHSAADGGGVLQLALDVAFPCE
ncbi:unnamed protein product [Linum trigynum]|uniref:Uncharacterized protein n=1 Tax=Linum trigynum TaxID=586398 RepID=A0AAV2CY88_9ROSI